MLQFGSMDDDKVVIKKPLLPSTMKKEKKPPSPSFLSEAQVLSLQQALIFACLYAFLAVYNLRNDLQQGPPCCCCCQCQAPTAGADAVDASRASAVLRGLLWCSAPQAAAAALALALLAGGRSRRGFGVRAAAIVALAASAASHLSHCMFLIRLLGLDSPGDLFLAVVGTAGIAGVTALDLLGLMAFIVGVGGDEQDGRAQALARAG